MSIILPETKKKPKPNACCNDPKNIFLFEQKGNIKIDRCKVCFCRHFVLKVDPMHFKMTGQSGGLSC